MPRAPRFALILLAACAGDPPDIEEAPRAERAHAGPMPLAFGDCAAATVAFVSGPRPLPFTDDEADLSAAPGDPALLPPNGAEAPFGHRRRGIGRATTEMPMPIPATTRSTMITGYPRGRPPTPPAVALGSSSVVVGALDKAIIRRYLKRQLAQLAYCYEVELLARPGLGDGTIDVSFTISGTGAVTGSRARGLDARVETCIAKTIADARFPAPRDGRDVAVVWPLEVKGPPGPPPTPRPPTTPPRPARERQLFRDPFHHGWGYQPGATSYLAARAADLADCFRLDPQRRGAAVVELAFDDDGRVVSSAAEGVPPRVAACIGDAVKGLRTTAAPKGLVRCPVAFGDTPIGEARGIDLRRSIALDGRGFGSVNTLDGQSIDALSATLREQQARVLASDGPIIATHPPLVVRPADDTPMRAVYSALASIAAAHEDVVLAARRSDDSWRPLRPITFPIAPVPFNTGGMWSPIRELRPASYMNDSDGGPYLSLQIHDDRTIWLGISRIDDFQTFTVGPRQLDDVVAALDRYKAGRFSDRSDLEIAADGEVPYRDVVALIDAATRSGFSAWQLLPEAELSARVPR